MNERIREIINKFNNIGAFHVFLVSIINKAIMLGANMIIVRVMSKELYGAYSYAYGIVSILLIFSDLGTKQARFQYCCETEDRAKRNAITYFLSHVGVVSNIIIAIGTLLYTFLFELRINESKLALQLLILYPLVYYFFEQTANTYRIEKDNKKYAAISLFQSIIYIVATAILTYFYSLNGLVIGIYLSQVLPFFVSLNKRKRRHNSITYILSCEERIEMIKYGLLIMLTNSVSSLLRYLDTVIVGMVTTDKAVLADYKIAMTIPNALSFVPVACLTLIYPYFVQHRFDNSWIKHNTHKTQLYIGIINSLIAIVFIGFSNSIIRIVFTDEYLSAVPIFNVAIITYFIGGTFRIIYGNILSMLHLVKVNFVLGSIECVINIITDVILIKLYGNIGASYSTLFITVLSSVLSGAYFYYHLRKAGSSINNV